MKLEVVADFPSFAVVEKPGGVLSTPGVDKSIPHMVDLFRDYFPGVISHPSVHRLDMDTTGLMIMAKNQRAHRALSIQFIEHRVHKQYEALLDGEIEGDSGIIKLAFRLDRDDRPRQIYDPINGKLGETKWEKVSVVDGNTRVSYWPITGRTHQLRVHSAHKLGLGSPIVGDRLYGSGKKPGELKLHAKEISFFNPDTNEPIILSSKVPF